MGFFETQWGIHFGKFMPRKRSGKQYFIHAKISDTETRSLFIPLKNSCFSIYNAFIL